MDEDEEKQEEEEVDCRIHLFSSYTSSFTETPPLAIINQFSSAYEIFLLNGNHRPPSIRPSHQASIHPSIYPSIHLLLHSPRQTGLSAGINLPLTTFVQTMCTKNQRMDLNISFEQKIITAAPPNSRCSSLLACTYIKCAVYAVIQKTTPFLLLPHSLPPLFAHICDLGGNSGWHLHFGKGIINISSHCLQLFRNWVSNLGEFGHRDKSASSKSNQAWTDELPNNFTYQVEGHASPWILIIQASLQSLFIHMILNLRIKPGTLHNTIHTYTIL